MAKSRTQFQPLLVQCHNGNWDRLDNSIHHSVEGALAPLSQYHILASECCSFRRSFHRFRLALHNLARNLDGHDRRLHELSLPRYDSNGLCHDRGDVDLYMCTEMGRVGCLLWLGVMDD